MKKVLIALFVALVLFCASGGLDRFVSMSDDHVSGAVADQ